MGRPRRRRSPQRLRQLAVRPPRLNAGAEDVDALVTFSSQNGGTPKTTTITIPAGQVRQFDQALTSLFGASNDGGAVHIATVNPARLVATARTYDQVTRGTYGQFISAVTPAEAAGVNDRPLQPPPTRAKWGSKRDRLRVRVGAAECWSFSVSRSGGEGQTE